MSKTLPVKSSKHTEIQQLLNVYETLVDDKHAYYVSAPLTSGRRYIEWHLTKAPDKAEPSYWLEYQQMIVNANRSVAKSKVTRLRSILRLPVIDPTALLDVPGWTQDDYRLFWGSVIERYVSCVIFLEDWQYSFGCSYEFLVAVRAKIPTVDSEMNPIELDDGLMMLQEAINHLHRVRLPSEFLESIFDELVGARRVSERCGETR